MGGVQHLIYRNSGEVKHGTRPEKGVNNATDFVNGCSITAASAKSVTHMLFRWCIYITTFQVHTKVGKHAMRLIAWVTGNV